MVVAESLAFATKLPISVLPLMMRFTEMKKEPTATPGLGHRIILKDNLPTIKVPM